MATEKGQRKGKFPLPLHSIPSTHWTRKCQVCARSKLSGMPPAAHRSGDLVIGWSGDRRTGRHWDMGAKSFGMLIDVGERDHPQPSGDCVPRSLGEIGDDWDAGG